MTEVRRSIPANSCSFGPRPHLLTGYFREWFQRVFSAPENIEQAELRQLVWAPPVPPTTGGDCQKIVIEVESVLNFAVVGKRPALTVRRGDWTVERIGIDDRLLGGNNLSGTRYYLTVVRGSHTIFCLANVATQAELLAAEAYRSLMQFGPVIRVEADLAKFGVAGVGSVFEVEEARQTFAVPVTVAYAAFEAWELRPHAPYLKTVELRPVVQ